MSTHANSNSRRSVSPRNRSQAIAMVVTVEKDATGEPALLLERSRAITLQGRDRNGRAVVRIVGNYFPGTVSFILLPAIQISPRSQALRRAVKLTDGRARFCLPHLQRARWAGGRRRRCGRTCGSACSRRSATGSSWWCTCTPAWTAAATSPASARSAARTSRCRPRPRRGCAPSTSCTRPSSPGSSSPPSDASSSAQGTIANNPWSGGQVLFSFGMPAEQKILRGSGVLQVV